MTNEEMGLDPRYPIGEFNWDEAGGDGGRTALIDRIAALPARLGAALSGVPSEEWNATYRDGGWTLRQLVHHVADSHVNAYTRFRLALTEDVPTIRTYDEALWAELPDVAMVAPEVSLALLEALHARWAALLRALPVEAFDRLLDHPGAGRRVTVDQLLGQYAWHGDHHVAHVELARRRHAAVGTGGEPPAVGNPPAGAPI